MNNQIIIKYKKKKTSLEIVCDKQSFNNYKKLKSLKEKLAYLPKLLIVDTIFSNYKKGNIAKSNEISSSCNTSDKNKAIIFILENGDIPLNSTDRKKLIEQKRAGIINYFVTNFLDPVSKRPHPATRIDNALKSIKGLAIDPHKPVNIQSKEIMKKLKNILTFTKNGITTSVQLTHTQLGSGMGILKKYATILNEDYNKDGATFEIETTIGDYDVIMKYLNHNNKEKSTENKPKNKSKNKFKRNRRKTHS